LCTRAAVPYAQISVQLGPISDVSNRIAITAFAPFASASATILAMAQDGTVLYTTTIIEP